jgi:hypothetical protein
LCHGHLLLPTQAPAAPATAASSKPAPESPRSHANRSPAPGRSSWLGWGWGSQAQQGEQAGGGAGEAAAVGLLQEVEEASGFVRDMRQLRLGEDGAPSLPEDEPLSMVRGLQGKDCGLRQSTGQQSASAVLAKATIAAAHRPAGASPPCCGGSLMCTSVTACAASCQLPCLRAVPSHQAWHTPMAPPTCPNPVLFVCILPAGWSVARSPVSTTTCCCTRTGWRPSTKSAASWWLCCAPARQQPARPLGSAAGRGCWEGYPWQVGATESSEGA